MSNESQFVKLARQSIEHYLATNEVLQVPKDLPDELKIKAGAFVSLKKQGELRGCIGTFRPTKGNLAAEIIANAVSASTEDPRFWAVKQDELPDITISVDVLSAPEPIHSLEGLDPKKYGVIVKQGWRTGLLLPDLEGVDTVEEQIDIARQKAGIEVGTKFELFRFAVNRYH